MVGVIRRLSYVDYGEKCILWLATSLAILIRLDASEFVSLW